VTRRAVATYAVILPLMIAVVLATGLSHLVSPRTIYTLKLLRRGVDIDAPADPVAPGGTSTVPDRQPAASPRGGRSWSPGDEGHGDAAPR
jgi:hypothetical protein